MYSKRMVQQLHRARTTIVLPLFPLSPHLSIFYRPPSSVPGSILCPRYQSSHWQSQLHGSTDAFEDVTFCNSTRFDLAGVAQALEGHHSSYPFRAYAAAYCLLRRTCQCVGHDCTGMIHYALGDNTQSTISLIYLIITDISIRCSPSFTQSQ